MNTWLSPERFVQNKIEHNYVESLAADQAKEEAKVYACIQPYIIHRTLTLMCSLFRVTKGELKKYVMESTT